MAIKWTVLGLLVCVAMAVYLVAAVAYAARARAAGKALFAAGFALCAAAFALRWAEVRHVPLQSLFEVFLCLGMLMWPISLFSRRYLGVGGEAADAVLGYVVLFPAAFYFKAEPQRLPPVLQSFLFIPHVAAYMISYVIMAKAAAAAFRRLFPARPPADPAEPRADPAEVPPDVAAHRMASLGFPLLTLGLVLGAWWGKRAWGDYWNWDPKELWSLISWLVYLGYFHFRSMVGRRWPRASAAFLIAGLAAIVLTLLWVNLARIFSGGMHSYAS